MTSLGCREIPEQQHEMREFCTQKKHLLRLTSGLLLIWKGCGVLLNMTIDQVRSSVLTFLERNQAGFSGDLISNRVECLLRSADMHTAALPPTEATIWVIMSVFSMLRSSLGSSNDFIIDHTDHAHLEYVKSKQEKYTQLHSTFYSETVCLN